MHWEPVHSSSLPYFAQVVADCARLEPALSSATDALHVIAPNCAPLRSSNTMGAGRTNGRPLCAGRPLFFTRPLGESRVGGGSFRGRRLCRHLLVARRRQLQRRPPGALGAHWPGRLEDASSAGRRAWARLRAVWGEW